MNTEQTKKQNNHQASDHRDHYGHRAMSRDYHEVGDYVDPGIGRDEIEWMKTKAFSAGLVNLVAACDRALAALALTPGLRRDLAMHPFAEGWTRWQASSVFPGDDTHHSDVSAAQIRDLQRCAQHAGDAHARKVCAVALLFFSTPSHTHAINHAEMRAAEACARAWNARAARLRAAGVRDLGYPPGMVNDPPRRRHAMQSSIAP